MPSTGEIILARVLEYNRFFGTVSMQFLLDHNFVIGSGDISAILTRYAAASPSVPLDTYSATVVLDGNGSGVYGTGFYNALFKVAPVVLNVRGQSDDTLDGEYVETIGQHEFVKYSGSTPVASIRMSNGYWVAGTVSGGTFTEMYRSGSNSLDSTLPPHELGSVDVDSTAKLWMRAQSAGTLGEWIGDAGGVSNKLKVTLTVPDDAAPSTPVTVNLEIGDSISESIPGALNADRYWSITVPDSNSGNVAYEYPKSLTATNVPSDCLNLVLSRNAAGHGLSSSGLSSSSQLDDGVRRVVFYNANNSVDNTLPFIGDSEFPSIGVMYGSDGANDHKFGAHLCERYIVEAEYIDVSGFEGDTIYGVSLAGSNTVVMYKLYQAIPIEQARLELTADYLRSVVNDDLPATSTSVIDGCKRITFDVSVGWWSIKNNSNTEIGRIIDYDTIGSADLDNEMTDVGYGTIMPSDSANSGFRLAYDYFIGNDQYKIALYRSLYDSSGNAFNVDTDFTQYAGNSRFMSRGVVKGRLMCLVFGLPGQSVEFAYHGRSICHFGFTGSAAPSCSGDGGTAFGRTVEYVMTDEEFGGYGFDSGYCISELSNSSASITGEEVCAFEEAAYLNGDYDLMLASYNSGILSMAMPLVKQSEEIVYFKNELGIGFDDGGEFYVNGSEKSPELKFRLVYDDSELSGRGIPLSKVEVSYDATNFADVSESDFINYPYTWGDASVSDDISIEYDDGEYVLTIPYGAAPSLNRERIIVPSSVHESSSSTVSIGGAYSLMTCDEVNSERGLEVGDDGYITEDNYNGKALVYKHSSTGGDDSDRYIRYSTNLNKWIVSDSIDGSSYYITEYSGIEPEPIDPSDDDDDPCKALSNYQYSDSAELNTAVFTLKEADSEDGYRRVYWIRLSDRYGNSTDVYRVSVKIAKNGPTDIIIKLTGSTGKSEYTGMYERDGRYFPCEYITVSCSAISPSGIGMRYRLVGDIVPAVGDGWMDLESNTMQSVLVKVKPGNYDDIALNQNQDIRVYAVVEDAAGNTNAAGNVSTSFATIRYITRLFRTQNQHLVPESSSYYHTLYSFTGNSLRRITQKSITSDPEDYMRSWNEIWYPSTHGTPLNDDGTIDEDEAVRLAQPVDDTGKTGPTGMELLEYDRLSLDETDTTHHTLAKDTDGRYLTIWDPSKTYGGMVNSRIRDDSYETYWIVENSGNSDFRLEFEYFDFSGEIVSYPANLSAPYDGDMLCVYDASSADAVEYTFDRYGRKTYKLKDSSKLTLLFTLKGSYRMDRDKFTMINQDQTTSSLTPAGSGFVTPAITQCSRICLVPFTDNGDTGSSVASGFKLKAGPRQMTEYSNYDYINNTGEFWVHVSPDVSVEGHWDSIDSLRMQYKYYGSYATIDYEKGLVSFDKRQENPVLGTFTALTYLYANGENHMPYARFSEYNETNDIGGTVLYPNAIRDFALYEDDLVDYQSPTFNVVPSGTDYAGDDYYDVAGTSLSGKLQNGNGFTVVKDTGILTFNDTVTTPYGRIFGDYYHHTFYRLTSDGYGDLYFYGNGILVPASSTDQYSDWAYVDLRIVNEGGNRLVGGTLQFLSRGYITTGDVVDTVLDMNRPWDVQEGTTAETVQRTGAVYASSYSELNTESTKQANRTNAYNARSRQTLVFGTVEAQGMVYVRVFWCIANNAQGTEWFEVTKGNKTYSAELAGRYFIESI